MFRRRKFFSGLAGGSSDGQRDILWLTPAGQEMTGSDWDESFARSLAVCVNGDAITEPGPRGERITDADFILLLNAHSDPVTFQIPPEVGAAGVSWQIVVNTGSPMALAVTGTAAGTGVVSAAGAAAGGSGGGVVVGSAAAGSVVAGNRRPGTRWKSGRARSWCCAQ